MEVERWRLTTHTQTHEHRRRHTETRNATQIDMQAGTLAMHFSRSPLMALAVTAIIGFLLFGPSMSLIHP
jgi:sugar phosphate permease